jgi:hypothetical protein
VAGKPLSQETGVRVGNWITEELGIPAPGGKPNHAWRNLFTTSLPAAERRAFNTPPGLTTSQADWSSDHG